ncbi:hypothetical protein SYNTR_1067 [Candidatus Syntrophocurvum alkaliphilum]|uniref:Uncharacterized protein n=1 Tax=Candidatus Syntrophocurvum alkaliphilum TaxID=2293317 RepID=A0A6I6DH21_9FIRM|nr:hypothetical protein [Candidatus Syntrophocurvum alkaliphilum]QGT99660.1 hypothetical protein SYNTR_1067 [Candidatus Syntrophocurvum alkaliphilum]
MNEKIATFFKDILNEVYLIENKKLEISGDILRYKDEIKRLNLILKFVICDLDKHKLFEQAAIVAIKNNESEMINQIKKFYSHTEQEKNKDLVEIIRSEINYANRFIEVIRKQLKMPANTTFVEKRMVKEITKFITEQARLYKQVNK